MEDSDIPEYEKAKRAGDEFEQSMRNSVEKGNGFVMYNMAYVPPADLDPLDVGMIKKISAAYPGKMPDKEEALKSRFFSVPLESEPVHLIARRAFGVSINRGIDETFDALSSIYVVPYNVRIVTTGYQLEKNEALEQKLRHDHVETQKDTLGYYDAFLSAGVAGLRKRLNLAEGQTNKGLENLVSILRNDYIYTSHYEAAKLSLEILNAEGGNLFNAYSRFGKIVLNPVVKNSVDVLRALNYPNMAFAEKFLDRNMDAKFAMMDDAKYKLEAK